MRSFYKEVLGCTDEREQPEIGLYQLRAGHALIELITIAGKLGAMGGAAPGTGGRNLDHLALALDGFDDAEIRAPLARHGLAVEQAGPTLGADGERTSRCGVRSVGKDFTTYG